MNRHNTVKQIEKKNVRESAKQGIHSTARSEVIPIVLFFKRILAFSSFFLSFYYLFFLPIFDVLTL